MGYVSAGSQQQGLEQDPYCAAVKSKLLEVYRLIIQHSFKLQLTKTRQNCRSWHMTFREKES